MSANCCAFYKLRPAAQNSKNSAECQSLNLRKGLTCSGASRALARWQSDDDADAGRATKVMGLLRAGGYRSRNGRAAEPAAAQCFPAARQGCHLLASLLKPAPSSKEEGLAPRKTLGQRVRSRFQVRRGITTPSRPTAAPGNWGAALRGSLLPPCPAHGPNTASKAQEQTLSQTRVRKKGRGCCPGCPAGTEHPWRCQGIFWLRGFLPHTRTVREAGAAGRSYLTGRKGRRARGSSQKPRRPGSRRDAGAPRSPPPSPAPAAPGPPAPEGLWRPLPPARVHCVVSPGQHSTPAAAARS